MAEDLVSKKQPKSKMKRNDYSMSAVRYASKSRMSSQVVVLDVQDFW